MFLFFFFKQKTAYEMRISDWSSDVCSSDLEISSAIVAALRDMTGITGLMEIELDNRALQMNLPIDKPATAAVTTIAIDRRSDHFTAIPMAPDDRTGAPRTPATGTTRKSVW